MSLPWNVRRARNQLRRRGFSNEEIDRWLALHRRSQFAGAHLTGPRGEPWRVRDYQWASLESLARRKTHCDGRDVGKTAEIEIIAAWAMAAWPNRQMLIATQCENHLFPLMQRLIHRFQTTEALAPSLAELKRSPSWFLRFTNGFVLWGRIAGPHGMNFQGLHVDWQIVDEAQEMTETAWSELFQSLNGGGWRWVYGVPNGLRNTFHRMTHMPDAEQYNWPSSLNPEFTPEKDAELARLYGGRDSPGYVHRVLGQHGAPAQAVFNLEDYLACVSVEPDFHEAKLGEGEAYEPPTNIAEGTHYLGCDLGYARDPSEFVVYRTDGPYLVNVARVHLRGVNYVRQQQIIEALDAAYGFDAIGIDCGNNGRAMAHRLMSLGADWCARMHAFEFGSVIELEPLPDGTPQRRVVKEVMTELLERHMAERTIRFPPLPDRETQYAGHTYHHGAAGRIIYEKGDDHLIDADRCAVLAHHLAVHQHGSAPPPPRPRVVGF